jgi:hypothetical protein
MAANHMYDGPHTKGSNKTLISVVVDRSGSMESMGGETAAALSTFIKDQSNGNTFITAVKFDNYCERFIELERSEEVIISSADVEPRGMTALYEAIGKSIEHTNTISEGFDKVIFVILTDGHENSSQGNFRGESGRKLVKEIISDKEKNGSWSFFFLGANIDSGMVGDSLGMRDGRCINFTPSAEGCSNAYRSCSQAVSRFRDGDVDAEFNDEERGDSLVDNYTSSPQKAKGGYNLRNMSGNGC